MRLLPIYIIFIVSTLEGSQSNQVVSEAKCVTKIKDYWDQDSVFYRKEFWCTSRDSIWFFDSLCNRRNVLVAADTPAVASLDVVKYLHDNLRHNGMDYSGMIIISFIVETSCSLSNIRIEKNSTGNAELNAQACNLLKQVKYQTPAILKSYPVASFVIVPIKIE